MKKLRLTACLTALAAGLSMLTAPLTAFADGYPFRTNCSYYYDQLDSNAQRLYDGLYAAAQIVDDSDADYSTVPNVMYAGVSYEQMEDVIIIFMYDHPEFFWLANNYGFGYNRSGNYVQLRIYPEFQDGEARQAAKAQIIETAQSYISQALNYNTDYERSKYLTQQLYKDIQYATGDLDQSMASALLEKKTVCAGFTKAYSMLANAVGVDTVSLVGVGHGWNGTKIGGKWYHNDVTNALFLYCDTQIAAFDEQASYFTVTNEDGTVQKYLMHDLDYQYYTDIFPDMSEAYDGGYEVIGDEPLSTTTETTTTETTTTETTTTETTTTETTATETTTLETTASTSHKPRETTTTSSPTPQTTTTSAATTRTTTTTTAADGVTRSYTASASAQYFYAENTAPFSPADLIDRLMYVEEQSGSGFHSRRSRSVSDLTPLVIDEGYRTPAQVFALQDTPYFHGSLPASYDGFPLEIGDVWIVHRGDFDLNGVTNAGDASLVLIVAAANGSGVKAELPEGADPTLMFFAAKMAGNYSEPLSAADAAEILIYAAELGAGLG